MAKLPWLLVLRVATLVALAASAALLSDYVAGAPSFCSAASGCGVVRASQYSHLQLGGDKFIPLPGLGLVAFALTYAASMLSARAAAVMSIIGGLVGAWLLYVQAAIVQHFCWLCVTTDTSALVAALAGTGSLLGAGDGTKRVAAWAWWTWGALAISAPLVWPFVKVAPAVPSAVRQRYVPGKVNVVEFADFQCPACRRYHQVLKPILERYGDRVHFVRLHKPLPSHGYAQDAARAAVCAEQQGKLEPMADQLFTAADLSPSAIDALAKVVGLEEKAFAACILDPATNARVNREANLLAPPELEGLPTTYIGGKRLIGVQQPEVVEDAIERAARGEGESGIAWYVYVPLLALCSLLVLRAGLTTARKHGSVP